MRSKLIRFMKNFFIIKSAAFATILCLMAVDMPVYAYADEKIDGLHNVSEGESVSRDKNENSAYETVSGNSDTENEKTDTDFEESNKTEDNEKSTVSGNDIEETAENDDRQEIPEIINVVVPTTYTLALNPYGLSIKTGEDTASTEQVISGTYGIINKSSTDQIVTVSLTVEDGNGGEIIFVDSAEEVRNAEENVYAIYLEVVPANEKQILIDGKPADSGITGEALRKVKMIGAEEQAVTLHEGMNTVAFKLSGAVYSDDNELIELAPDGTGVSAYTFCGVMNPNAAWENLSKGIKLSVVYTYQTADGSEELVKGTGAMIRTD